MPEPVRSTSSKQSLNDGSCTTMEPLTVPRGEGQESSLSPSNQVSKGTGRDRALRKIFEQANQIEVDSDEHNQAEELDKLLVQLQEEAKNITNKEHKIRNLEEQNMVMEAKLALASANVVQATKAVQQMAEETCNNKHIPINSSLGKVSQREREMRKK